MITLLYFSKSKTKTEAENWAFGREGIEWGEEDERLIWIGKGPLRAKMPEGDDPHSRSSKVTPREKVNKYMENFWIYSFLLVNILIQIPDIFLYFSKNLFNFIICTFTFPFDI
jgi:hypothetical protein